MDTETIVGIDLGTTNSEVAVIKAAGRSSSKRMARQSCHRSSAWTAGQLLVGNAAATSTCWLRNGLSDRSSGRWARRSR